jgi:hypothetical protein
MDTKAEIDAGEALIPTLPNVLDFALIGSASYLPEAGDVDFAVLIDPALNAVDYTGQMVQDGWGNCGEYDGVSRSINDVDASAFVNDRSVLRTNGNAAFALKVHGVHDSFAGFFVGQCARSSQQSVHKSGLAVVDVRDDCDVTYFHNIESNCPF